MSFMIMMSAYLLFYQLFPSFAGSSVLPGPSKFIVWGPGLDASIVLPSRYFFIQAVDSYGKNITGPLEKDIEVKFTHEDVTLPRIFSQLLNKHDGSYIVRYVLYESYKDLILNIVYDGKAVGGSPYVLTGMVYTENCYCPVGSIDRWIKNMKCSKVFDDTIKENFSPFPKINATESHMEVLKTFNVPGQFSLVRYVIKDNEIHRSTFGTHVGFKMFSDNILLSITRKVRLPDMELFFNLGDWPLISKNYGNPVAIVGWCGHRDTLDLILPTYEIMTATLDSVYNHAPKVLTIHTNHELSWSEKEEMAFWRGRDSSRERLELVFLSDEHRDLIDAKLTHIFFFTDWKNLTTNPSVPFFDFFKYKYLINMDGTVSAYRYPYLMGSRSLILKQDSDYYEHFYTLMKPYVHYVPFKKDLSDLIEKIKWAKNNDDRAYEIAMNAAQFSLDNLMPADFYCYHALFLKEYASRLVGKVTVEDGMERVNHSKLDRCHCPGNLERQEL